MTETGAVELCEKVGPRLVGALTLACGDRGIAEELAQEALARAWERWPHVSQMASPEAWVFRTGFNLASSWRRRRAAERRANRRSLTPAHRAEPLGGPELDAVRGAVSRLPDRQRSVIVARFYLGYDVAGAATLLGCAPGTIKAATHQALANLRLAGLGTEVDMEADAP